MKTPPAIDKKRTAENKKIIVRWNKDSSPVFVLNPSDIDERIIDRMTSTSKGRIIPTASTIPIIGFSPDFCLHRIFRQFSGHGHRPTCQSYLGEQGRPTTRSSFLTPRHALPSYLSSPCLIECLILLFSSFEGE